MDDVRAGLQAECQCDGSSFIYESAGHIFSGDLNIVHNDLLRDVMSKGTKFRLLEIWRKDLIVKNLQKDLEEFLLKMSRKHKIPIVNLLGYRTSVLEMFQNMLNGLDVKHPAISMFELRRALTCLHEQFVICSADKASGNCVFVCKMYYLSCVCKELGIGPDGTVHGNMTYLPTDSNFRNVLDSHRDF